MQTNWIRPILALVVGCALALGQAHSTEKADAPVKTKTAKKKKAKTASTKSSVKFMPGSAETRGERSARLKRECRGGVNAGACSGYTN